jgi:DNA-binding transcriptional MerR regulator
MPQRLFSVNQDEWLQHIGHVRALGASEAGIRAHRYSNDIMRRA